MLSAAIVLLMLNKPVCDKQTHGQMWPALANSDRRALLVLAQSGELEMCMASGRRYRWQHPTVHIHQK